MINLKKQAWRTGALCLAGVVALSVTGVSVYAKTSEKKETEVKEQIRDAVDDIWKSEDTSAASIAGVIADEMAIGMVNQKTTAVRLIPVIGKKVGDNVEFGGLLGYAPVMPVNRFNCENFVDRGGRIPAPIHSFKN